MFWKKKEKPVRYRSRLIIYWDGRYSPRNRWTKWEVPISGKDSKLEPWKYFIKWFHCRQQSDGHTICQPNDQHHILRKTIIGYEITAVRWEHD